MPVTIKHRPRLTPLATCLALALAGGVFGQALAEDASPASNLGAGHPQRKPYLTRSHNTRAAQQAQHPTSGRRSAPPGYVPRTTPVGSCADDGGPTTLRSLVAAANSGDTLDLSALACSSITLTTGEIGIKLDDLTLIGPSDHVLSIDANHASRAFFHSGYGTFAVDHLTIANGSYIYPNGFAGGAGIDSFGSVSLSNSVVTNCYSSSNNVYGGAVDAEGALTLTNSSISNSIGKAAVATPVLAPGGQTAAPADTTLSVTGGGAYSGGGLTLTNSTISGNQAIIGSGGTTYGGNARGAGVFAANYMPEGNVAAVRDVASTITGSTVSGNSVNSGGQGSSNGNGIYTDGGGLYLFENSLTLSNSTISGNSSEGFSGGIEGYESTGISIYNSTIAQNTAGVAAGIYVNLDYDVAIHSSIIATNTATDTTNHAADLAGGFAGKLGFADGARASISAATPHAVTSVSDSNNLITSHDPAVTLTGTVLTGNPLLAPLANNGGPTLTHALGAGSPAINAGDNLAGLAYDQRGSGFARSVGAAPDIGAFEVQAQAAPPQPIPTLSAWMLGVVTLLLGAIGLRRQPLSGARRG